MREPSLTSYDPAVQITVVVVNWNGRDHLELCLGSLLNQSLSVSSEDTRPRTEIILVDNGSTDGSVELVRERFGDGVRILREPTNIGYGAALNAGIRAARGRYLLALNNDTELDAHCLAVLLEGADRHPEVGSFAPKILSFDDRDILDNTGHVLYPDGLSRGRGRLQSDRGQFDEHTDVISFSGCAVLLRRAMLADVGLFDERLFAYCEDTDLGLRARLAGWSCRFVPGAIVYHKYSASTAHYSPLKAYLVERNRAWVAIKCLPAPLLVCSPLFTVMRFAAQAWGALSGRGAAGRFSAEHSRCQLALILLRALAASVRGLPHAWRARRAIRATRRISSFDAFAWLTRYRMGVREAALTD